MHPSKLFHTIVVVGAALTGGCDGGPAGDDAGGALADAAMDAAAAIDAGEPVDAGEEEDGMVLIL
ncbi:MAG: hypothetical protein KF729_18285 [Sandaracinaceae bacterium]|nr:hypothetical protein [Sandaracinaceae bacterium]